jgi:hypothetical protein
VWLALIRAEGVNGIWVTNGASGKPGDIPEYTALHWHRELCWCGPYFSRTRGTKTDTIEKELKQGATADLLQQKSFATSDEEGLAAGILMIGLQTMSLSGVQRHPKNEGSSSKPSPQ